MTDTPGYGYITVESSKVLEACTEFLRHCDEIYQKKKQDYIERIINTKKGWFWNKRYYTDEEAEHMWYNGSDDYLYSPHELAKISGSIWKDRVKDLMILAKNSDTVMVSSEMAFIFT